MSVAKGSDELWVEVKCQANPEIAGSPRNALRCSLRVDFVLLASGGRALNGLGGPKLTKPNQTTNAAGWTLGVRQWGISFIVERETAQTRS